MEKEIVYTEEYALILSDDTPTTWYYDSYSKKVMHTGGAEYGDNPITKSIIAHRPLPNSGYAILKGVPLLPSFSWGQQDDVENLAKEEYPIFDGDLLGIANNQQHSRVDFIKGYNKAKEKYKYTEFDIIQAFEYGWNQRHFRKMDEDELHQIQQNFIQSLQQPSRPTHFECEMMQLSSNESFGLDYGSSNLKPKTTTNSQGQLELAGKYLNL